MSKIELLELLQQDIEEIKEIISYEDSDLPSVAIKNQAKAVVMNLQDHLETNAQVHFLQKCPCAKSHAV